MLMRRDQSRCGHLDHQERLRGIAVAAGSGARSPRGAGAGGGQRGPRCGSLPAGGPRTERRWGGRDGCGAGLRFGVRRRHLLEPALAVLALVPHPARVAEAGGVDTAAGEAGAGPLARLGLGHLRVQRQVEEAIAQEPAVPVQQPGGGAPAAAAAARRPNPPQPRGRRLRGASAGPDPGLHLPQRPCPAGLRSRAPTGMLLWGNAAGGKNTAPLPLLLPLTGACPSPAPRSGETDPSRRRLRSAPSSRTRASPLRLLTLSAEGRAHRRGAPGRAGGRERAAQAERGARKGTCGRGRGPRARPRLARGSRQLPRLPAPRTREGGGHGSPEVGAPNAGGGDLGSEVQPFQARPAPSGPPVAIFFPGPLASRRDCSWGRRGPGPPPQPERASAPPPARPGAWSRPALTGTGDSPTRAHPPPGQRAEGRLAPQV